MPPLPRPLALVASTCLTLGLISCGGDDAPSTPQGSVDQAVERLVDFGLTEEQATCVIDDLGAESVAGADLNALSEGEAYRGAVERCVDDE